MATFPGPPAGGEAGAARAARLASEQNGCPQPLGVPAEPGRPELDRLCAGWGGTIPSGPTRNRRYVGARPSAATGVHFPRGPGGTGGIRVKPPLWGGV